MRSGIRGTLAGRIFVLVALVGTALALVPGTTRAAPSNSAGSVIDVVTRPPGWRGLQNGRAIDYWTQDPQGRPVPTSGALFVPAGPAPKGGWPVVAYTHGTSGYGPGCGGQSAPDAEPNRYITRLVHSGYAVVATDYVGLGRFDTGVHPYLNTRSESAATIDMLRAARSVEPTLSNRWAVTGDSQGGQAALATAHRQRWYGPRTDFRGTVSLDPESDVEKVMPFLGPYIPAMPTPLNGSYNFLLAILAGLRAADPAADVNTYLTPKGEALVDQVGRTCDGPAVDPGIAFGSLLSRPLGTGPLAPALMKYMAVPVSEYDAPILLLLNTRDTTVPSPLHAKLAADFALNRVDYRMVVGNGSHTDMDAAQWAAFDRFFATHLKRV